ncbi:tyrosine-type recombinase/integrase [Desnuesiella massiliensis]|uniref:tyrosine-type recombinase/integrase n=1 Tax=Desnuesiella massiliensis TaxID=1650662 RepID=UPI0006E39148|nr:tyrosine-type recombinase/integrase [Desnuesiella massiliensis]
MQGTLRKRGQKWYVIVDLKGSDGKRKQKWINTKCEKKTDAEKALRAILTEIDKNTFIDTKKIYFIDFIKDWLDNVIINKVERTTWDSYEININRHIIPFFKANYKDLLLKDVQPIHLQKYYNSKYKGNNFKKDGLSANSLTKHHANIKSAFDYALRNNLISYNPADRVELPKKEKFSTTYYTVEQIEKLLEACKGTDIEAAVFITARYGLRRGEICGLKWAAINFDEGTLTIQETRVRIGKETIVKKPKSESSLRTLPLIPEVEDYLKKLQEEQEKNKKALGDNYNDLGYVCCWDDGTPLRTDFLNHKFSKILKNNNFPHIRFHDLRHSTASYLIKNGVDLKNIQSWLGHADFSTTADIYSHIDMDMKQKTAKKINDIFSKNS